MLKVLLLVVVLEVSWASLEPNKSFVKESAAQKREKKASGIQYATRKSREDVGIERSSWRRELVLDDQEVAGDETKPTFKPFSQEELNHYLKKYAETQHDPKGVDSPNRLQNDPTEDKSKSWHLVHSQAHNHPYDDRLGWVTLEPVAWSQGKVQKWEPNKPLKPHWDRDEPPPYQRPERPYKPTYEYKPGKPSHWDSEPQYTYGKPTWQSWNSNPEIITDNRPSHFPEPSPSHGKPWYEGKPQTEVVYHGSHGEGRPSGHPGDGDGRWVLISSTKGYSYPSRKGYQRSLNVTPKISMSSHRTVRLTVLPALNDTTKTTTSHGGLLEVESTSQTVDEAQREHAAKMLRLEKSEQPRSTRKPLRRASNRRSSTHFTVIPVNSHSEDTKNKALLAAVGAGMIPATVAMLLPALAGRKKRSLPANATLIPTEHLLVQYM